MIGSLSLIREDVEKRAPTSIMNALGEVMVLHHTRDSQGFYADAAIPLGIALGDLEVEVAALAANFEMLAGNFAVGLASAMTPFCAAADRALRVSEALLPRR